MEPKQLSEQRFALLIDADNVSAKYLKPIMDELSKYGSVTYKRIYGDWTLTLHAKWKDALLENSITPIQQFGYTQGKNATDSAMIIDAMDILYTHSVDGFCIVSSDSDFTRLAARIRESGLMVIGMGEKKTPVPFRKACDIFTTLELLVGQNGNKAKNKGEIAGSAGQESAQTMGKEEIERAVVDIITDNQNNGKSTGLGEVGSRLLKRYPDFDVRSFGTNLLSKLLDEFEHVKITKDGSSVAVELVDENQASKPPSDAQNTHALPNTEQTHKSQRKQKSARQYAAMQKIGQQEVSGFDSVSSNHPSADSERFIRTSDSGVSEVAPSDIEALSNVQDVDNYLRRVVSEAGRDGIPLTKLARHVRMKFRSFKVRDLGYTQFKNYVADFDDIEIVKIGKDLYARLGE